MNFSGKCTAHHPIGVKLPDELPPALSKVTFFDVQWTDCPVEIEDMVRALWAFFELGNDNYMIDTTINHIREMADDHDWYIKKFNNETIEWEKNEFDLNVLADFLLERGVEKDERIIIHWWW
jgi:hypothetical protein